MSFVLVAFCLLWLSASLYGLKKKLPPSISMEGEVYRDVEVDFLYDLTFSRCGKPIHEQNILGRQLDLIEAAQEFLILDFFLFGDENFQDKRYPDISTQIARALINKKKACPGMHIIVITDELNTCYGSLVSALHEKLRTHGIKVVLADLGKLRDSNWIYSGFWRLFLQWFDTASHGRLPSPFSQGGPRVTLRAYLKMFNFKANHRKVLLSEKEAVISSGNIDDGSAFHSNIAFAVRGGVLQDILQAERAVAAFSGEIVPPQKLTSTQTDVGVEVRYLTEGKIKKHVLGALDSCEAGGTIYMGMFYLSEREIMQAIIAAAHRGVTVRILLDPSKDAFGRKKSGVPNRPVARHLVRQSENAIELRWYDTHGEQFHTKLTICIGRSHATIIGGSANMTRRNIGDFNLESCISIRAPHSADVVTQVTAYFERIWDNQDGGFTLDMRAYDDCPDWKWYLVRFLEKTGMCTF